MILKFKYHSDNGLLEAYQSYVLAQNNSLSDTIVITSTDPNANDYNYCLEFVCYNSKSIPKAQYISPVLVYGDDLSFAVPNNLTQFRGHVDMQLTGYSKQDNSVVFKSIRKNCKAFDVEGSLCVLENDLNDTPNVFTEVMRELDYLRGLKEKIEREVKEEIRGQLNTLFGEFRWYRVRYYVYDELVREETVMANSKANPPRDFAIPSGCRTVGGWYSPVKEALWDFEVDTIEDNIDLFFNFMSNDITISDGTVTDLGAKKRAAYIPEYFDGRPVRSISQEASNALSYQVEMYFCLNMIDPLNFLRNTDKVVGVHYPHVSYDVVTEGDALYLREGAGKTLVFYPNRDDGGNLILAADTVALMSDAIKFNAYIDRLIIPSGVISLAERSIVGNSMTVMEIPVSVTEIAADAVVGNVALHSVFIHGDLSDKLRENTFVNATLASGEVSRPTLYVRPEHYADYIAANLPYVIKVMGEEYFRENFANKE